MFFFKYDPTDETHRKGEIEVRSIDTKVQKADIFTKGLDRREFENKRTMLMG
jgi:hypothetical protein